MRLAAPLGVESLLSYATGALGAGALAAGDVAAATAHLERARRQFDEHGARCLPAVPFAGDLVDATARAGDRTAAEAAVAWVAANAERTGSAYAEAIAARGRGLLADDPDAAERWFAAAHRAHERFAAPYEKARTTLAHAEVRRRWRRPGAARPLLLEAEAAFAGLGAHPWTERTRNELAATGHRASVEAADDTVVARGPDPAGVPDRPRRRRGPQQRRGVRRPVRLPEDGRGPPDQGLSQARRPLAHRAGGGVHTPS